ncbi:MAG: hypothetical protein E6H66_12235 [Betaproteobacteria bacterium]|nr:MAG: hypothetical protein E6H66_12235 [Betaproteobacteria bacterium]
MQPYVLAAIFLSCTVQFGALGPATAQQPHPMPSASEYSAQLLPVRDDVVPWKSLNKVRLVKENDAMVLSISDEILALDQKSLRVQGFMIPLGVGDEQNHFLISAVPPSCPYCVPAVAYEIVEVRSNKPIRYGTEPIVMSGTFAVLRHDPSGVIYRMSDAVLVAQK